MPFVKLDCGILNSTLWFERHAREVFITALLMAEPHDFDNPQAQLEVDSMEPTGWSVPPGWYGFVPAAGIGIIHRAQVEPDAGIEALKKLGAPEGSSRSPEYDGRRLVRIAGGYVVLNFMKYRERDYTAKERQKRFRKKMASSRRNVTPSNAKPSRKTVTSRKQSTEFRDQNSDLSTNNQLLQTPEIARARETPPPDARSKRPIFRGQRFVVFEWMLDDLQKLLGPHCAAFDLHSWFYTLDERAQQAGVVVPQRDGGKWLQRHTLEEAQRRGLVAAESPAKRGDLPKQFVSEGPSARDLELIAAYERSKGQP